MSWKYMNSNFKIGDLVKTTFTCADCIAYEPQVVVSIHKNIIGDKTYKLYGICSQQFHHYIKDEIRYYE